MISTQKHTSLNLQYSSLLDSTVFKTVSRDSVIKETPELSVFIRKQRGKLTRKIKDLENDLKMITDGIVV